jgi:high affinity choline transporter 7
MTPLGASTAVLGFYAAFLGIGIWAGRRRTLGLGSDEMILAGRRLPLIVGAITMTATWVGGGYIVGTAEAVYDPSRGVLWTQAPWCYALSLIIGGMFFAARMRRYRFTTLLDLFERRYGKRTAAILYLPALFGEMFWAAAILAALGTTIGTILGVGIPASIILSTAVVVCYTVFGGLWSVAYTDVLQMVCILLGLVVALGFALEGMSDIDVLWSEYQLQYGENGHWLPSLSACAGAEPWVFRWADSALLLILGGIPWQVYFQRVLACEDEQSAVSLSVMAGIGCLLMAIPAILIGLVAVHADWSLTDVGYSPEASLALPYVLRYLTPTIVATIGLGAVAAAVMSSVDSSLLSASSMFAWNVYRPLIRSTAGDREIRTVIRLSIVVIGVIAATLAIQVGSVYTLWYLCADFVYVLLFPQLVLALYNKKVNATGALAGSAVGLFLRLGGGEPLIGLAPFLPYPLQDAEAVSQFPFRTFAMLSGLIATVAVSRVTSRTDPPRSLGTESGG